MSIRRNRHRSAAKGGGTVKRSGAEFSQGPVIVSWAVSIMWISFSYVLALLGLETNENVTVALVTEAFAVTLAYYIYQAFLKNSRNKYGVDAEGVPYRVKAKLDGILHEEQEDET